ncbi:MAG: aminotransferase class V-fold PLP-dependent enzyme [Treponema sp.]|uniref:threonine aldolase family protein n=1 Tax=Treponema sp. TaxID=166 RepID=UPI00298E26BD|nr:aminotransferase class V-fold PLP-dependent enzyme [Treponema sp.]MCQ2599978.1 aminotransferase class V-fold PLP-dependent enzyme [Treponema sp.]
MLNFESDYIEGAHQKVLDRLVKTNMEQLSGYGADCYTDSAREKIKAACNCPDAQIEFVTGGTQTNQLVIDTMLKSFEGVVAARTGHVAVHEAGAIEYTGHKVLEIPGYEGKMKAEDLDSYIGTFYADGNHEHMVFPGMVYISFPTEYGTLYSKNELTQISDVCHKYKVPLFIDGARLGYGLKSPDCDLTMADVARLCDVFYIGGTKVGALCGEAIVYTKGNRPEHFDNHKKRHGALLAKGRLLSVQFDELFTDNLYFDISENAITLAMELKNAFKQKGYELLLDSPTNQQFVILENKKMEELAKEVKFSFWEKIDENHTAVRFATSWATTRENLTKLIRLL